MQELVTDPPVQSAQGQLVLDAMAAPSTMESIPSTLSQMPVPGGSSENEKRNGLDATSLAKWNKLAERGGIGKAVGLEDCMANRKGDLMFLAGDEITVLRVLTEDIFLVRHRSFAARAIADRHLPM